MPRFRCVCAYDGTSFSGWQSQVGGNTVQDFVEQRLCSILNTPTRIHASGRTDAGVHALGQVFHFDTNWKHGAQPLERALRSGLPEGIQVTQVRPAQANFHARFSATGKRYRYCLHMDRADPMRARYTWSVGRRLDIDAMHEAAQTLKGTHDFRSFAARRNDGSDETLNPVRTLKRLDVQRRGLRVDIVAEADGFLYKMVRSLTGALVSCGLGRLDRDMLHGLLAQPTAESHPYETAPARGLCLEKVFY